MLHRNRCRDYHWKLKLSGWRETMSSWSRPEHRPASSCRTLRRSSTQRRRPSSSLAPATPHRTQVSQSSDTGPELTRCQAAVACTLEAPEAPDWVVHLCKDCFLSGIFLYQSVCHSVLSVLCVQTSHFLSPTLNQFQCFHFRQQCLFSASIYLTTWQKGILHNELK